MSRRTTLVILSLLGVGALLTAGAPMLELVAAEDATLVEPVEEGVTAVVVETRNGTIDVVSGSAQVELATRWSFTEPDPRIEVVDGVLTVRDGCPRDRFLGSCRVDVTVTVPEDVPVDLTAINGAVRIVGRSGPVEAGSTNGELSLLRSTSTTVRLVTVNGSVEVELLAAPQDVLAETTNGGVTVTVPAGAYAVTAGTTNGPVGVEVRDDPTATNRIVARSVNGPVRVLPRADASP